MERANTMAMVAKFAGGLVACVALLRLRMWAYVFIAFFIALAMVVEYCTAKHTHSNKELKQIFVVTAIMAIAIVAVGFEYAIRYDSQCASDTLSPATTGAMVVVAILMTSVVVFTGVDVVESTRPQ